MPETTANPAASQAIGPLVREAKIDDAESALALVLDRKDDIPFSLDGGQKREDEFYETIQEYCASHRSIAAIDRRERQMVGCILLRQSRRLWSTGGFDIDFIVVRKKYEGKGIMSLMMREMLKCNMPLLAHVRRTNRYAMQARLIGHFGFTTAKDFSNFSELQQFFWSPQPAETPAG